MGGRRRRKEKKDSEEISRPSAHPATLPGLCVRGLSDSSWGLLGWLSGISWRPLGSLLGPTWGPLGGFLGPPRRLRGPRPAAPAARSLGERFQHAQGRRETGADTEEAARSCKPREAEGRRVHLERRPYPQEGPRSRRGRSPRAAQRGLRREPGRRRHEVRHGLRDERLPLAWAGTPRPGARAHEAQGEVAEEGRARQMCQPQRRHRNRRERRARELQERRHAQRRRRSSRGPRRGVGGRAALPPPARARARPPRWSLDRLNSPPPPLADPGGRPRLLGPAPGETFAGSGQWCRS